jgi:Glyoxalase-like domain
MQFTIGHVLIKTENFRKAVKDFEQLGFQVTYGSSEDKATNALIYFEDGSFLELYDAKIKKPFDSLVPFILKIAGLFDKPRADRYVNYTQSVEGVNEYALDSVPKDDYAKNMEKLKIVSYDLSKEYAMKRNDLYGNELKWNITLSKDWRLPFFMSPYSPDIKKKTADVTHQNGVTAIKRLVIGVDNMDYFKSHYDKILGAGKMEGNECIYQLDGKEICLRNYPVFQMLEVWLKGTNETQLDTSLTHSANIYITL